MIFVFFCQSMSFME